MDTTVKALLEAASAGCSITQRFAASGRRGFLIYHNGHFIGLMSEQELARWTGVIDPSG
jgi:hypothetical protein